MSKKRIKQIIREEFLQRLAVVECAARIAEAELYNKKGQLLVSPDLKVKHKKSGYEYTVDSVDGQGEDAVIRLRKPDIPRIDPPDVTKRMNELDDETAPPITPIEMEGAEIFTITAEEFEEEYIVD